MKTKYILYAAEYDEVVYWTIPEILKEVNRDHSAEFTDYDAMDWREGVKEWTEYTVIGRPAEMIGVTA